MKGQLKKWECTYEHLTIYSIGKGHQMKYVWAKDREEAEKAFNEIVREAEVNVKLISIQLYNDESDQEL